MHKIGCTSMFAYGTRVVNSVHSWTRMSGSKVELKILIHFYFQNHGSFSCLHKTDFEYCISYKQDCLLLMSVYSVVNDYQQVVSHTLM